MSRYLISDHHFGHSRIIDYTDRPFSSAAEMNQALLNRHYETVNTDDMLIHLGDVAMDMRDGSETISFFDRLNGGMLIRGNHDTGLIAEDAPFLVAQSCVLAHGDRRFDCTHRPNDIPSEWEGWAIHGHMHNNDTEKFPFIAEPERRINVSCELLNYRPIKLSTVTKMIDACPPCSRIRDLSSAHSELTV